MKVSVKLNSGVVLNGTGVLICPDVVAVVGHLLDYKKGHAVHVMVYAGYNTGEQSVEKRRATCAVMHYAWYDDYVAANDLAFLHLESEFAKAIQTIPYVQTPATEGNITGHVIAFSGDMKKCAVSTSALQYNPSSISGMGLLEHKADTKGGASGGAVLNDQGVLIAIHKGCVHDDEENPLTNTAVTVDRHGNDFGKFIGALRYHAKRLNEVVDSTFSPTENQPKPDRTYEVRARLEGARWKNNNACVYFW